MSKLNQNRTRQLNSHKPSANSVVYWMVRDQRIRHNWALLYAQDLALQLKQPLVVVFCLRPNLKPHLGTTRLLDFLLPNLRQVKTNLSKLNIHFKLLLGDPLEAIPSFLKHHQAGALVTDFFPINPYTTWHQKLSHKILIAFHQVDAHNIVPPWHVSTKQEYAAQFFRRKIHKLLPEFLTPFPKLKKHPFTLAKKPTNNWPQIKKSITVDPSIKLPDHIKPGELAAHHQLNQFIKNIRGYNQHRNDPNQNAQSGLSPYLHFGHISAQFVAHQISQLPQTDDTKAFLEELIVRRELADNFCFYNSHYRSIKSFPNWAKKSLSAHQKDKREHLYSRQKLETAATHDDLWNAAQLQMVITGKMHGYLRMYWAKKILEWSNSPDQAMDTAIYLNDKYSLDGRDPNGYTGIAWSIGGVHDRPWFDRPILGQIRYMSRSGADRKFDTEKFINSIHQQTIRPFQNT